MCVSSNVLSLCAYASIYECLSIISISISVTEKCITSELKLQFI